MRVSIVVALLTLPAPLLAQSSRNPFGLGIEVGDPFGFTLKYWRSNDEAVQFGFGTRARYYHGYWNYYDGYAPMFTGDYLFHFGAFGPKNRRIYFRMHLGMGGGLGWVNTCVYDIWGEAVCQSDTPTLVARVPVGFNVYLAKARFEFYGQFVPGVRIYPRFYPMAMGGLGARFYF